MKNILLKSSLICLLVAALCGCDPANSGVGDFALGVKKIGPDYVELSVTAPSKVEMAYVVADEPQTLSPAVTFLTGKVTTVSPGQVLRIERGLYENTGYYLYAAAKLNDREYTKMIELQFETGGYNCTDLLTVVGKYYDGYKIHITLPESTKEAKNAIRFGGTSLSWYNVLKNAGSGETMTALNAIIASGNRHGNYTLNDTTLVRDNSNVVLLGADGKPIKDEYNQSIDIHDPIAPGEPTVFLAGECKYGSDSEMGDILGYYFDAKDNAYIVPLFDWDTVDENFDWDNTNRDSWEGSGWTGAFQKIVFETKKPGKCDATVEIEIPEEEITVTNAKIYFTMDPEVSRYFYMVLDNDTYNQVIDIYLDKVGKPEAEINEAFQWFLTSYLAFYEWGIYARTESITAGYDAAASFNDGALIGGETYHVLCTVMVDDPSDVDNPTNGAYQKFIHKTFKAKPRTKPAPIMQVSPVKNAEGVNPSYTATFNIKVTNKDVAGEVEGAYWACNSAREFEMAMNGGATYESLLKGNYTLSEEEIEELNSEEGLTLSFPTLDGEITRFAIYGVNDEYNFNQIDPETKGVGWNDYEAPMAEEEAPIETDLFEVLAGDWTMTANIYVNKKVDGSVVSTLIKDYKSKVTISNAVPELPATLTQDVYDLYEKNKYDKAKVDQMYEELGTLADRFTEYRLAGQNRLLCNGFIDYDSYSTSRMKYMSPYDLFIDKDYSSYDVAQIIYDFGPKWFLQVREDENGKIDVIVPFNSFTLPPLQSWAGYPFYLGGVGPESAFYDSTPDYPGFPVEISDDRNTITIKPIVIEEDIDSENDMYALKAGSYYMNALGVNPMTPNSLELVATIKSDIVLTRGWTEPEAPASIAAAPRTVKNASAVNPVPQNVIKKSRTPLQEAPKHEYKVDENPNIVTMEMVKKTQEDILKRFNVK